MTPSPNAYQPSKRFTVILAAIALLVAIAMPSQASPNATASPRTLTLTILHDNDIHGHILPFAYTERGVGPQEQPSRGGAARRATFVRSLRQSIHNPVLLVDTGDIATRGPFATTYQGIIDVESMNAVGYDIAAVGNNEFKLKDGADQMDAAGAQADLLEVIKRSRFPWICANATDSRGAMLEGVEPYVVRDIDGVRIGFLGLTAPRSASYPQTKGWTITDPIAAAKQWIPEARKHCDILIAMTHVGVDLDKQIAAQTSGLDAIIGGDSHTFLYKPVEVANTAGQTVPIVQDGEFGADLGRFDLSLAQNPDGTWKLASYTDVLMPIGPSLREAPDVDAVLEPFVAPFRTVVGHIGPAGADYAAREHQIDQMIAHAMRQQTGADIAIQPCKPGDDGLYETLRHEAITRYDVYASLPFHDNAAIATMTGAEITALLAAHPDALTSGVTTTLDAAKTYRVAIVDYVATSIYHIPGAEIQLTDRDEREVLISYLQMSAIGRKF